MVRNVERINCVKQLRDFARAAGITQVREDAGRQLVTDMVSKVRATGPAATELKNREGIREQYIARLKAFCADVNATCDVEGLRRAFPKRVQALMDAGGACIHP